MVSLANAPMELEWAAAKVTAQCMQRNGFEYPPYSFLQPIRRQPGSLAGLPRPLTVVEAQREGYGDRIATEPNGRQDDPAAASRRYLATLTPQQRARYERLLDPEKSQYAQVKLANGIVVSAATTGCVAEGRKRIYGSVEAYLRMTNFVNEVAQFGDDAANSALRGRAGEAYSSCMRKAGYDADTPGQAVKLADDRFGETRALGDPPSDAERAMAVADARCQTDSQITRALDDAFVAAAATWINDHEPEILALADKQRAALRRAQLVLQSG